jgi:hypothetical protein
VRSQWFQPKQLSSQGGKVTKATVGLINHKAEVLSTAKLVGSSNVLADYVTSKISDF